MPQQGCLMITQLWATKNRLIGIHFAELTYNKMSDTEEVVEEEVVEEEAQYVHTSVILMHYPMLFYVLMINVVIIGL